jgi:lipopolysaccharide export system ATP-binding protein
MLRADTIFKRYKKRTVVNGVSVEVRQGEIVGLLGPNGAGKTTSFYMIVGLVKPNEGHIYLDNEDITDLAMYRRAQKGHRLSSAGGQCVPQAQRGGQHPAILEMTDKYQGPSRTRSWRSFWTSSAYNMCGRTWAMCSAAANGDAPRSPGHWLQSPGSFCSMSPFAGVDPIAVEDIQGIVAKLKDKNIGILITDHNVQETLSITDRAYLLYEGQDPETGNSGGTGRGCRGAGEVPGPQFRAAP